MAAGKVSYARALLIGLSGLLASIASLADPFPPLWENGLGGAVHHAPAPWPNEPVNAADCGSDCGQWKPYTRFQNSVNDPRAQDPSNGGTAPQNYVNIASSCIDKDLPSIYYHLHQGATPEQDVIMFRWRVEQIANTYATGPNAGSFSASSPWSSALWTVLFDIDGSGFRSLAAHLNGSSGGPATPIDMLAGIWSQSPTQSIDYLNDPNVHLLGHNPTAFVDQGTNRILNFRNALDPTPNWPNGSAETTWDYGTTRARQVSTRSCNEYFVDYQIPVAMLDATHLGGPSITRSTPISMLFCTANSLNNPFQKDCALNKTWAADSARPAPFGDYISFDKDEPYRQPIIAEVTATAPAVCGQDYRLTAKVQDVLAVVGGQVVPSVRAVDFYYWHDTDGSGYADEPDGQWRHAASATRVAGTMNTWTANWNATSLPKGRYLIGVQAVDDNTLVDDGMTPTGVDNRTFSYLPGDAQSRVYVDGGWIAGQQAVFPAHSPAQTPAATENWYGNPDVTGIQTALVGVALNVCGVAPTVSLSAGSSEVGPGGAVTFTLTVDNAGNPDAITVDTLEALLPDGFGYQSASTGGGFGADDPTISGQRLTWNPASPVGIAANGSASLTFTATAAPDAGNYNAIAYAGTSFGLLESDPVAVAVGSARLALSLTPDRYSVNPGGQVSYTLNYSNPSTVAVNNATVSFALPAGTSLVGCTPSCSNVGGNLSWSPGSLAQGAGGSVTLTLAVDPAYASVSLTANASLAGNDPAANPVTATAQSTLHVAVPVGAISAFTLEKTASAVRIAPGASVTYTLAYHNYGGAAASDVVLSDTLPAGMTHSACSGGCGHSGGIATWNLDTVAAGASGSVTLTVTAANPFLAANPAVNNAEITWDGGGPVSAAAAVGITGQSCSTYFFRNDTTPVGADGSYRIATVAPVPLAGDAGSSVTVTAPSSGSAFLEALRFYQDPASPADTDFNGTVASSVYIDRASGQGLNLRATLYDYDSVTGDRVQLGQETTLFNGSARGRLDFSVPVSGTLRNGHRLLWVIEVRSNHNSQTVDVQIQFNGTVANAISGGTTFADSGASFCVTPPANLRIDKIVDAPTVPESTTSALVYTLNYANLGATQATNAQIVDTLPAGVSFVSATLNGAPIVPSGANPYTFTVGTVAAGASGTLLINTSVGDSASGLLTNTAALSSDQTSPVTDTAGTLVGAPGGGGGPTAPALFIVKSASSGLVGAADSVTYSLTVVNAGNGAASNVSVTDDFPEQAYLSYMGCTTATGSCGEAPAGTLVWDIGTLGAGGAATLSYDLQTAATGLPAGLTLLDNVAVVSDDDHCSSGAPPAGCTSDTVTVAVSGNPELDFTLTASDPAVAPGDVIEYSLTVSNTGSSAATGVTVYDPIPSHTGFVAITSGTGEFDTINNRLVFSVGTLAAAASATYTFTVRIADTLASGTTIVTNTATATAVNAAAVTASATSTATAASALTLNLSGPGSVAFPATTLTADAVNATTLSVASAALLASGDVLRIDGTLTRITAIAGSLVTVDTPVTASAGSAVQVGATYSLVYRNTGTAAADAVQLSIPLPAGWLYVASAPTADSAPATGVNGTLSWDLGSVAPGDSGTLQFIAIPTASGSATHTATLTADGGLNEQASVTTLVGGLVVSKTAASASVAAGGSVSYTLTLSNSLSVPVYGVEVKDVLPAGFSYSLAAPLPDGFEEGDASRPVWILDVPANDSVSIVLTAAVAADAGAATYQNEVEVVAPAGVGVAQFDALASTAEDVTLLAGTGLMTGYVYRDLGAGNEPLSGIWVHFYDNGVLAYTVYTDSSGRFQRVLEAGGAWRVEIGAVAANSGLLAGLDADGDPESFAIASGESLDRMFVFRAPPPDPDPEPVVHELELSAGGDYSYTIPAGASLSRFRQTRGGALTEIQDPLPGDYADMLACSGGTCRFTASRSGRYEFTYTDNLGNTVIRMFVVHPNVSFTSAGQMGTAGLPVTVRVVLDDLPIEEQATVPFAVLNEAAAMAPDPADLFSRAPRVLDLNVGPSANMLCFDAGACYRDLVFTPTQSSGTIRLTLLDTADLDGARLGDPIAHTVSLVSAAQQPLAADLTLLPGNTVTVNAAVDTAVTGLPFTGHFAFDWSRSDNGLSIGTLTTQGISFSAPATPGVYAIRVEVADLDDLNRAPIQLETWLRVIAPGDVATVCSGDCSDDGSRIPAGRVDSACGLGLNDPLAIPYRLQIAEDNPFTEGLCLETPPGYGLRLGTVSFLAAPNYGAGISDSDIRAYGNDGRAALNAEDPAYAHLGLYYDFEVTRLDSAGQAVPVVIPLPRNLQIPAAAVWRKYHPVDGWYSFGVDDANAVHSARRVAGVCPSPNSARWQAGLLAGHDCVRLTLADGGRNDLDGQANGVIRDPGVLAIPAAAAGGGSNTGGYTIISGGEGGGVLGPWSLIVAALAVFWRRFGRRLGMVALSLIAVPAQADSGDLRAPGWYLGGIGGMAHGETDSDAVTSALRARGIDATAQVEDLDRPAWRVFGGYRLGRHLALEGGYTYLGKVTTRVNTDHPIDLDDIPGVPPASGRGFEFAVTGLLPVTARTDLFGRAGVWYWEARYHVDETGQTRRPSDGADGLLGLGLRHAIDARWQLSGSWDRYRIHDEDVDLLGVGVLHRWR